MPCSAMKLRQTSVFALVASVWFGAVAGNAELIFVEEPEGLGVGLAATVDFNDDGVFDLRVRYYDYPICISAPEGGPYVCTLGISLEFGPQIQFLGTEDSGEPTLLLPGDIVGPVPAGGVWMDPSPVWLVYEYGTASYVRNGYPEFTQGLARFAIGFRLAEDDSQACGYVDVSLWQPSPFEGGVDYPDPVIEGIELSDEPDAPVTVALIPEPGAWPLAFLGAALLWKRARYGARGRSVQRAAA